MAKDRARITVGVLIALYSLSAMPDDQAITYHNGNRILGYCESDDSTERVACMAYLAGLADMTEVIAYSTDAARVVCKPREVPIKQLRRIFIKYANDNPESLHLSAASMVRAAFTEAFPCSR